MAARLKEISLESRFPLFVVPEMRWDLSAREGAEWTRTKRKSSASTSLQVFTISPRWAACCWSVDVVWMEEGRQAQSGIQIKGLRPHSGRSLSHSPRSHGLRIRFNCLHNNHRSYSSSIMRRYECDGKRAAEEAVKDFSCIVRIYWIEGVNIDTTRTLSS